MATTADAVLAAKSTLLLDFDGPVCRVFAHHRAPDVAENLRALVDRHGMPMAAQLLQIDDPLLVLRIVDGLGSPALTRAVAHALFEAELTAVETATPTPGGHETIAIAAATGRKVAIVSNNSEEAVCAYLERHGLAPHVHVVSGRYAGMRPSLMKPDPHLLCRALNSLQVAAGTAVMVGDSATDVRAAHAAGVTSIGYANRPDKVAVLERENADAIVTTMTEIATLLEGGPSTA